MYAVNRNLKRVGFYRLTGGPTNPLIISTGDMPVTWNNAESTLPTQEQIVYRACDCALQVVGGCICSPLPLQGEMRKVTA